jgi:hypothetical protein
VSHGLHTLEGVAELRRGPCLSLAADLSLERKHLEATVNRTVLRRRLATAVMALVVTGTAAACGDGNGDRGPLPSTSASPSVDPADFVTKIGNPNPYFPLVPGTKLHYKGSTADGPQEDVVEVTNRTKNILGVRTVVVRDTATEKGEVVEATADWYAQDRKGNVWYFGEDSKTIKNGKVVSTEGSWKAGKHGAEPGIIMKAKPEVGDKYRQEHAKGVAEDRAEILSTTARIRVPPGSFDKVLKTKDDSPLEPKIVEHKYYARGVGAVREISVKGEKDELRLVRVDKP